MNISFITRFRRHLATIPFVIVLLLPIGGTAIYVARHNDYDPAETSIQPIQMSRGVEEICDDPEPLAVNVGACLHPEQGAE